MIVSFHRLTSSSFMIIVTCHPTEPNTACILGTVAFDPCFSVLLEKLIVTLLVKKLSSFYGTQSFITMFNSVLHWSLPHVRSIQFTTSHTLSLRSILILSSQLRQIFRVVSSLQVFQPEHSVYFSPLSCVLQVSTISVMIYGVDITKRDFISRN